MGPVKMEDERKGMDNFPALIVKLFIAQAIEKSHHHFDDGFSICRKKINSIQSLHPVRHQWDNLNRL
jgi:hypothetical protein